MTQQQNPNRQVQQEPFQSSFGGGTQLGTAAPQTQQLGQQGQSHQVGTQQTQPQTTPQQLPQFAQQIPQQAQPTQQAEQTLQPSQQYLQEPKQVHQPQQFPQLTQQPTQQPGQFSQPPEQQRGFGFPAQQGWTATEQPQLEPLSATRLPVRQGIGTSMQARPKPVQAGQASLEATAPTAPPQEMTGQQTQPTGQAQSFGQPTGAFAGATGEQTVPNAPSSQLGSSEMPPVDMYEGEDEFVLLANLAGYDSDEIDLEASGETLRIVAARQEAADEDLRPVQRERLNRAERVIQLPSLVDIETAEATCENGVCRITLPKAKEGSNRRIGVE